MKCAICEKSVPEPRRQEWAFAVWFERRLLPAGATTCDTHPLRRACEMCLEPTGDLAEPLCRLCSEFVTRRGGGAPPVAP